MSILGKLKGFVSDTAIYGVGSMFSRMFSFFLIPLYTGYLDKPQYANLILLQLLFTVLSFFLALNSGVFFYYYEYKPERIKRTVFSSWLAYELVVFFIILVLAFLLYPVISPIFEVSEQARQVGETFFVPFLLIVLQLLPFLIYNTYYNLLRIKLKPTRAVLLTGIDALLVVGFVVYFLVYAEMGVKGVVLGQLVAKSVLAVGVLLSGFYRYFDFKFVSWAMIKRMLAYASPFFLSSTFLWIMNSSDKIIGTQMLESQAEVAFLGLAMQVTMPIILLAGVISQSFGPYVMSIRKNPDANQTYEEIFSFVAYVGVTLSTVLITFSPFLIDILADHTFYVALKVIPLFAIAGVLNILMSQVCLGLNLTKKNIYIAIATIVGGSLGFLANFLLQPILGIIASGLAQILAYGFAGVVAYTYSQKFMPIGYDLKWAAKLIAIMALPVAALSVFSAVNSEGNHHVIYFVAGTGTLVILLLVGERKYRLWNLIRGI